MGGVGHFVQPVLMMGMRTAWLVNCSRFVYPLSFPADRLNQTHGSGASTYGE